MRSRPGMWMVTVIAVVLCLGFSWLCWSAGHISYEVPGRAPRPGAPEPLIHLTDVLWGHIAVSIIDLALAAVALAVGWMATRQRPRLLVAVGAAAVVATVVSLVTLSQPTPTF